MPRAFAGKLVLVFSLLIVAGFHCSAQTTQDKPAPDNTRSQIAGTWRGNSVCMVENSPCRDELNVYHFSEIRRSLAGSPLRQAKSSTAKKLSWERRNGNTT